MSCKQPCTYKYKILLWTWKRIYIHPYSSQRSAGWTKISPSLWIWFQWWILFTFLKVSLFCNARIFTYFIKVTPFHSLLAHLLLAFKMLECLGVLAKTLPLLCNHFLSNFIKSQGFPMVSIPVSPRVSSALTFQISASNYQCHLHLGF